MATANKIIEINGKRYDAVTGKHLGSSQAAPSISEIQQSLSKGGHNTVGVSIATTRGGSIDGFRRVRRGEAVVTNLKPVAAMKPLTPKPVIKHKPHAVASNALAHKPQKAVTLMRSAVKKPDVKAPSTIKAQSNLARTDVLAKVPAQTITVKTSINSLNAVRNQRAVRMIQNPAVSRFGTKPAILKPVVAPIKPVIAIAPAVAQPEPIKVIAPQPIAVQPARTQPVRQHPNAVRQVSTSAAPVRPAAVRQQPVATPAVAKPAIKETVMPDTIFEEALAAAREADGYGKKGKGSKRRNRAILSLGLSMVILLVVGFFAYHNTPQISLKVASYRAGLHAKLPAYHPTGYDFSYLDYQPGTVTVNYVSAASSQQYNISQKASNWDSQALLSNYVASANSAYKTFQRAGRTVYVLGNNTATWVDSGIWYTVDGNASLTSNQLLDLASSM